MRLLLISNSTNAGEEYLAYTLSYIQKFLDYKNSDAVFIPYAGVTITWDDYFTKVHKKLKTIGIELTSVHHSSDPIKQVQNSSLIIVGGGNTFHLLKTLQDLNLVSPIRNKVLSGTPYIGWSAGSNIACPTISTTNDMPIVQPQSFMSLYLVPFQINPHYTDNYDKNHAGETREMRIKEFIEANPDKTVIGLREGTMFLVTDKSVELWGNKPCRIFKYGINSYELNAYDNFSFLMQ